jgi:putative transposase
MPTPEQARAVERVVWRLRRYRTLYTAALQERKTARERAHVSVSRSQQKAELTDLKVGCPDYVEVNAQVLQHVILRVERAFRTFFHWVQAGEEPGYPRFQGRTRYNSFTHPQYGGHGGVALDGGVLSFSRIGRIPIRLPRPLAGTPKTVTISREADGWYACISCAGAPCSRCRSPDARPVLVCGWG